MQMLVGTPAIEVAARLTSHGFVQPVSPELIDDVAAHIAGDLVVRIFDDDGEEVGFATFSVHEDLLYLNGIMLDPAVQGNSYAQNVISFARDRFDSAYLGLRTQNPKMWSVGKRMCDIWLPDLDDRLPDKGLQGVIDRLQKERNLPHPLHEACYGEALYGDKPVHRDEAIQRWWDELCDFERGDGVVCVGRFGPAHR